MADTTPQERVTLLAEARKQRVLAEALDAYIAASDYVFQSTVRQTEPVAAAKPARVKQ